MKFRNFSLGLLLLFVVVGLGSSRRAASFSQACSLKTQGYLGGCDNIYSKWLDGRRDAVSYLLHYSDGYSVAVPGNRSDWSRTGVGCGWSGQIVVTGNYPGGAVCSAQYSGNLPHNRGCDQCVGVGSQPLAIVNAANSRAYAAPGSIVAAYSTGISTETASARSIPLPREMGGVRVFVGFDQETQCELFYVSPNQINFLMPDVGVGLQRITAVNASGQRFAGDVFLTHPAPGVFTRDGTGEGRAAADWYPWGVSLYVTGLNPAFIASPDFVRIRTRGQEYPALWVGWAPGFVGLAQVNVPLPAGVAGSGASLFVGSAESQGFLLVR